MKVQDEPAYILHQRPFRDTSQLIELFSKHHGRLSVVSRGSRGAKSKLKGVLQPFRPLVVSWSGKGEMPTLTGAETVISKNIILSGDALPSAFYINELLMKLLHRYDVHSDIYKLYESTLLKLQDQDNLETSLRFFEKDLLQFLGFGLNLTVDADSGEDVSEEQNYIYYVEHGPVATIGSSQDVTKLILQGRNLLAFERGELASLEARKKIKSLLRYVLNYYLEGKPLKSRELFR